MYIMYLVKDHGFEPAVLHGEVIQVASVGVLLAVHRPPRLDIRGLVLGVGKQVPVRTLACSGIQDHRTIGQGLGEGTVFLQQAVMRRVEGEKTIEKRHK